MRKGRQSEKGDDGLMKQLHLKALISHLRAPQAGALARGKGFKTGSVRLFRQGH